mgnify:CR=1 FL=1
MENLGKVQVVPARDKYPNMPEFLAIATVTERSKRGQYTLPRKTTFWRIGTISGQITNLDEQYERQYLERLMNHWTFEKKRI